MLHLHYSKQRGTDVSKLLSCKPVHSSSHQGEPQKSTAAFVFVRDFACRQVLISDVAMSQGRMKASDAAVLGWGMCDSPAGCENRNESHC